MAFQISSPNFSLFNSILHIGEEVNDISALQTSEIQGDF